MDNNLWTRRNNPGSLSLSTSTSAQKPVAGETGSRSAFPARSSHGKSDPFSSVKTPGSGLASPGAANAFALGSSGGAFAFASFGSAKTPKTPGNPFESSLIGASGTKTPSAEKSASAAAKQGLGAAASSSGGSQGAPVTHPLRSKWVFWFRPPISKANGYIEYEKTLHPMARCATIEEFWSVHSHLKRPSALPVVSDYHLFKEGVRPIWEDAENKDGGKFIVRLKKGVADRYWEELLMALVGDQFNDAGEEICGAVLSVRNGEDILSIWVRSATDGKNLKIRETMKRILAFPVGTVVDWKNHTDSIQQRTEIEESRRAKGNNNNNGGNSDNKRSSKQQQQHSEDNSRQATAGQS